MVSCSSPLVVAGIVVVAWQLHSGIVRLAAQHNFVKKKNCLEPRYNKTQTSTGPMFCFSP